jgi:predicted membrane GTPase involved in stress response
MLVTMIDDDPFVGRIATGRIASGVIRVNDRVKVITRDGAVDLHPSSTRLTPVCMQKSTATNVGEDAWSVSAQSASLKMDPALHAAQAWLDRQQR